ncbi:MAG: polyphosphate polymerase domain-containing protein [Candidatus Riflebacteria bacterium]|nr:polyphosphate polymerase domain-containing protein [Candidatus Riflebacteria bacterium]
MNSRPAGYQEIKFFVSPRDESDLKKLFAGFATPDIHGDHGSYFIGTVYFDTPKLDFFMDKIEGEMTRIKIRLRSYADPAGTSWTQHYLELKSRLCNLVYKRRIPLSPVDADRIKIEGVDLQDIEKLFAERPPRGIARTMLSSLLKPMVTTLYRRTAFTVEMLPGLRLTFDHDIAACLVGSNDIVSPSHLLLLIPVIFEIKSDGAIPQTILHQMHIRGIGATSVSKYALALEHIFARQKDARSIGARAGF